MSHYGRQLVQAVSRAGRYAAFGLLCVAGLPSVAVAQPTCGVSFTWDVHPDWATLAAFDLEYGTTAGVYTSVVRLPARINESTAPSPNTTTSLLIPQPTTPKSYYFVLRSVDAEGRRSGFSNMVQVLFAPTCGGTTTDVRLPSRISGAVAFVVLRGS